MKRLFDILVSSFLIIVLSPVFIVLSIAIFCTSPGPILFRQHRIGYRGKIFCMFKFRSMVPNAEKLGTGLYSFDNDPRITRLGHLLRKSSLDELPQLFNVLFGSMTLVGPRPPVTYELGPWEEYTSLMLKRFTVKPGITGLAQTSGRSDLDWDEKIRFDNVYVDRLAKYGITTDFMILAKTFFAPFMYHNTIEKDHSMSTKEDSISARARFYGRSSSDRY